MFNKETEYAMRGLVYIQVQNYAGIRPGTYEISREICAPRFFTAKILQRLVRMGLLRSFKGKNGGFYFDADKPELTIKELIYAVEGDKKITGCGFGLEICGSDNQCSIHDQYVPIREAIEKLISTETIQSLALKQEEAGEKFNLEKINIKRLMRNVTKILSDEHQNIVKVTDIVLNECDQMEKGKSTNNAFFEKVILFIQKYADGFHHKKEEDILFKTMLSSLDNMHCNPIPVMLNEHDEGREYVKYMIEALSQNNKEGLIENARGYCHLLQDHIYKEDNILYPMAEQSLNEEQKKQVEDSYKEVKVVEYLDTDIHTFIDNLKK
ncbi:MAG: hemerythrin domain-containing protein [Bacteroidales bacterium]|nr:hemerythrin domain-containing protein [Bacteroidales bacterium]